MTPLDSLRDIHTPVPIGWWPLAPGWWILIVLTILLLIACILWFKRRQKNHTEQQDYRKAAIHELDHIVQQLKDTANSQQFIHNLSLLMKRYVHAYQPDASILTGQAWLTFLDRTGGNGKFQAFYHHLCVAPYAPTAVGQTDELIDTVRAWIQVFPQFIQTKETH